MKKLVLITILILITYEDNLAQSKPFHLYTGPAINLFGGLQYYGSIKIGFGGEIGCRYDFIYFGGEFGGLFPLDLSGPTTIDPPISSLNSSNGHLYGFEKYFGSHLGIVLNNGLWVGLVFLWHFADIQRMDSSINTQGVTIFREHWINVGLDLRGNISQNVLLNVAISNKRGFKLGFSFYIL